MTADSQAEREAAVAGARDRVLSPGNVQPVHDGLEWTTLVDALIAVARAAGRGEAVEPLVGPITAALLLVSQFAPDPKGAKIELTRAWRIVTEARHALSTTEAPEAPAGER